MSNCNIWEKFKKTHFGSFLRKQRIWEFASKIIPSFEKTLFHYGNCNKDKIFYVIKGDTPLCGTLSFIFLHLPDIDYAIKRKYIPIIDCKNYYMPLMQDEEYKHKENAWEYYYKQPIGNYTIDEVMRSHNVRYPRKRNPLIDRRCFTFNKKTNQHRLFLLNEKQSTYWSNVIRQYIKPTDGLKKYIETKISNIPFDKVLGVTVRAGYRWGGLKKYHYIMDILRHHHAKSLLSF